MLTAAFIALLLGAALGALWLLGHVGPGWPTSMNDATETELRIYAWTACALLALAIILFGCGLFL